MKILIDTNVVITYATNRDTDPDIEACQEIIKLCSEDRIKGYLAFHSIANMWFILKGLTKKDTGEPLMSKKEIRNTLRDICEILTVVGADNEQILKAIDMDEFGDFEDCLQDRCAEYVGADYIITSNVDDFKHSIVRAVMPRTFLETLNK